MCFLFLDKDMSNNYSNNFLNNLKNLPPHRWMMLGVILFLIFVVGASDKMIQGAFNRVEDRKSEVVVSNKTLNIVEPIFEGSEALEKKIGSLRLADHVFDSENLIVKYSLISETDNINRLPFKLEAFAGFKARVFSSNFVSFINPS